MWLPFDLIAHLYRQHGFSLHAFGPRQSTRGVLDHIKKEVAEAEAALAVFEDPSIGQEHKTDDMDRELAYEFIDIILLSFDALLRRGYYPEDIARLLFIKQTKNESRTYPDWRTMDPHKAVEHDRESSAD